MINANNAQEMNSDNKPKEENTMKMEITFTAAQTATIMELLEFCKDHPATGITTIEEIVERIQIRGIYDINYRTRNNVKKYQEYKIWRKATR